MSATIMYCLSGCTVRGQHVEGCAGSDCKGCAPRTAEYGRLCAWCWQRLNGDIATAPSLVRHLRELAEPHAGTRPPGDGRTKGDPAFTPLLSGAVDAADEVHATLASWGWLILEEHPDGEHMAGPDQRGARITAWSPAKTLPNDEQAEPYYVGPSVAGILDPEATTRLVRWLLPLLGWAAGQEWAGEMRREVGSTVNTTLARWPMEDTRTHHIVGVQCTSCGAKSLTYQPTTGFRLPFHVWCTNVECGRMYTEDEYDGAIGKLAIERGYVA